MISTSNLLNLTDQQHCTLQVDSKLAQKGVPLQLKMLTPMKTVGLWQLRILQLIQQHLEEDTIE